MCILILAIGSGGAASILTYRILKNRQAAGPTHGESVRPSSDRRMRDRIAEMQY